MKRIMQSVVLLVLLLSGGVARADLASRLAALDTSITNREAILESMQDSYASTLVLHSTLTPTNQNQEDALVAMTAALETAGERLTYADQNLETAREMYDEAMVYFAQGQEAMQDAEYYCEMGECSASAALEDLSSADIAMDYWTTLYEANW